MRLAALFLFAALLRAQVFPESAIDAAVEDARKAWKAPGIALAIVHNDKPVLMKGYGVKRLGAEDPVTPDTVFVIASMTKAFGTASMAMLIDDGKMTWDDPVRKHLPYFRLSDPLADANVTLRDIVSHRTGLSRHDILWIGSPWNREELIRKIGDAKLSKQFRAEYQYQNLMFTSAGEAVAKAAGIPWEEFVRKRIFEPLKMHNSSFNVDDAQKSPDHASAHQLSKGEVKVSSWRNVDNIGAAGEINSTVRDLANWMRLHLNRGEFEGKRLISARNMDEMHSPQTIVRMDEESKALSPNTNFSTYGLGWRIYDYAGEYVVSHGGSLRGFRSHVVLLPKHKTGFVILSNLGERSMPEALRNSLLDIILGKPARDWNNIYLSWSARNQATAAAKAKEREAKRRKDTRPSLPLDAYAGTYSDASYGDVTVTRRDGALYLKWSAYESKLQHFHLDTFDIKDDNPLEDTTVQFVLGPDATVARLQMLDTEFRRKKPTCATSTCSEQLLTGQPR